MNFTIKYFSTTTIGTIDTIATILPIAQKKESHSHLSNSLR